MEEIVLLLEKYGAWALVVFLSFGVCRLLKEGRTILKEKDDMIEQMSKEQRTEIVAVVRECTAILTTVSDFLDRYERHFDQHTIELEKKQREKHE
ncbi:MAG: hypothetical protein PHT25_08910 [Bacteroidales bacterium]|jgi:hypothetical protein|nr:hypothetical protein [Bacteroidales bacterium]